MADLPRASLRAALALVLVVLALLEAVSLLHGVRAVRRLQARVVQVADQRAMVLRPTLDETAVRSGGAGWPEAAMPALRAAEVAEFEAFDAGGRRVFARPTPAPVPFELRPGQRARLDAGGVFSAASQTGDTVRVSSYLSLASLAPGTVLRLSWAAVDLEQERLEQKQSFYAHLASLLALGAAALMLLRRDREIAARPSGAMRAYEQAMERLRDQGEATEARHDAERRRMESVIREKEAMVRAGELTAGIVHEVRNGLGTIVGYARLVERGAPAEDVTTAARSIRQECEGLEVVVRRFTDFVRLEELHLAPADLSRLVSRVAAREQRGHERVHLRLQGLDRPAEVRVDEELLERAIENVLRNAFEMADSGDGGEIDLLARSTDGGVELIVQDDGPGLAADHPGEIRPFYSTRPGGLGLGLPLSEKIVRLHGGSLRLARRAPRGLIVTITLPTRCDAP